VCWASGINSTERCLLSSSRRQIPIVIRHDGEEEDEDLYNNNVTHVAFSLLRPRADTHTRQRRHTFVPRNDKMIWTKNELKKWECYNKLHFCAKKTNILSLSLFYLKRGKRDSSSHAFTFERCLLSLSLVWT
jgi:hypothetical protein